MRKMKFTRPAALLSFCTGAMLLYSCSTGTAVMTEKAEPEEPRTSGTILIDCPEHMNTTVKGDPGKHWVVSCDNVVPAKPNTWYRASVEIKTACKGNGAVLFRVLQVGKKGESLVFDNIAKLTPAFLDYNPYTDIFLTQSGTRGLRVYYHLSKVDGTASFRNLKLEELSEEEVKKIRAAQNVPPAYFAPPVYAYAGEKELPWGYRISATFLSGDKIPAKISVCFPELDAGETVPAEVNVHARRDLVLKEPLKIGRYTVVMTALDAEGGELAREERVLRVIARPEKQRRLPVKSVRVDENGNTVINGKPVLLNGIYHVYTESEVEEVAEAGFNTVIAWDRTPEGYRTMLDWISKYDLYADCVIKRGGPEDLKKLFAAIGGHPSIVTLDPEDEPDIKEIPPEMLQEKAERIRTFCPDKPLRISCSGADAVKRYRNCAEILCAHHYVIPFGGLAQQTESTAKVTETFPLPRKHSPQMTLQSWIHWHDRTCKPQTPEQTRSLAYIALVNGAKGLWWYSFIDEGSWDVRTVPSVWTVFKGLNAELEDLSEVILTGKRLDVKIESLHEKNDVIGAVWQLPQRTVLIVVNTSKEPSGVRVSSLPGKKCRELFADGAEYEIGNGTAEIPLEPETPRVFELLP